MKSFTVSWQKISLVLLAGAALLIAGCQQTNISASSYNAADANKPVRTERGVIIAQRMVTVQDDNSELGTAAGAVTGGIVGSTVGSGSGRLLAATAGALAGGFAGNSIAGSLSTQDAVEYSVELNNGDVITLVQGPDPIYAVGTRVLVQMPTGGGQARVIPDHSGN